MLGSNAMDFDDLLMLTVEVLERFPEARKRWQKAFRYVLVDEYQDTNHAQYRLLQLLGGEHGNVCAVGDPDQCVVEGTLITMADGSTRPIERVRTGDEVRSCHGSGAFRPARVTNVHRSRRATGIAITTASGRRVVSTPEHTHFAGFKPGTTPQLHMTYLMWKREYGFRVGTSRTYTDGRHQSLAGPAFRMNQEHADAVWVLSTHATRGGGANGGDVGYRCATAYPRLPFVARSYDKGHGRSLVASQAMIDEIFDELDTAGGRTQSARRTRGSSFDHPHFPRGYHDEWKPGSAKADRVALRRLRSGTATTPDLALRL